MKYPFQGLSNTLRLAYVDHLLKLCTEKPIMDTTLILMFSEAVSTKPVVLIP